MELGLKLKVASNLIVQLQNQNWELLLVKSVKMFQREEAPNIIAGFTTIIDMTAEDILQRNPRYLTRSKSFDTFFSFGPHLITPDEVS